jgi:ketosteroid isomerase-like protein
MPTPKEVIEAWGAAFNARDAAAAVALYHEDAINEQVAVGEPLVGHVAIFADLAAFFRACPDTVTHIEHLLQDDE